MSFKSVIQTIKKVALALAVVVVLNIFLNTGVSTFNPSVEHEDVCPTDINEFKEVCIEEGGEWNEYSDVNPATMEDGRPSPQGYCDMQPSCWEQVRESNRSVESLNFVILAGAGVLALVLGVWVAMPSALANGLMYGGVLSILIGWIRAAQYLENLAHFVISGIFLAVLFWVGVKKLKD